MTLGGYSISSWARLFDEKELIECLNSGTPAIVGLRIFSGFYNPKEGKIPLPEDDEQYLDNHSVCVHRYIEETEEFYFVNSWGEKWGDKGYGYIPLEYVKKYMLEAFVLEFSKEDSEIK